LLFSRRRPFLLHCIIFIAPFFFNHSNYSAAYSPLHAASPSAAALVFSLIFTSSAAAFIALQRETRLILAAVFA
jgi:O-antigen ligase